MAVERSGDAAATPRSASTSASKSAPRKRRRPWLLVMLLLVVPVLLWGGVKLYPRLFDFEASLRGVGALTYEVHREPLQVTVTAQGNVESTSNVEVKCRVAGGSTILWIVEDGKVVEEGEEIVRLDTAGIEEQLNAQRIVYEKARAVEIQAREDLEAATISVKEYEEGTFVEQLKQAEADIQIALENLRSAENQLKYSKRMARKGFVSSLQREADEFAVERAKLDLDTANTRKKVLVEFTRLKTLKDLVATREAATARLRSEEASLQLEEARLGRLQDQLKNCVIYAPKRGMVVYANNAGRGRFGGSQQVDVEEGATVRESQALVRLPDLSKMQVKVTVHESRVDEIHPGMPASVVIQDEEYRGHVISVANQPERTSWFSANVKEYATTVSIEDESLGLRPGMTAKVTILVHNVADALTVPVSAVVEQRGAFFCWVEGAKGPQRRPLVLGRTNDKVIEVLDGIGAGDIVLRNPRAVLDEAREEEPFEEGREARRFEEAALARADLGEEGASPAAPESPAGRGDGGRQSAEPAAAAARSGGGGFSGEERPSRDDRSSARAERRRGGGGFNLMQFDTDGDGKLSVEELPERMQGRMERFDTNGDGAIDATEASAIRGRRGRGEAREGSEGGDAPR